MKPRDLRDLADFCNFLEYNKVAFSLHYYGDDTITVFATFLEKRVEIAFSREDVVYSVFQGNEDVERDVDALTKWIETHAA